jgi:glycosyltransferase involved in cell wall biosynthesis
MNQHGTNPLLDVITTLDYYLLYRRIKPAVILHYTPKTNIYGSLAARAAGIPCINNVAGMGEGFASNGVLSRIVRTLYRISQRDVARVFFQNPNDYERFRRSGDFPEEKCDLLPGSGVDTDWFSPRPRRGDPSELRFLLSARLLWEKGIAEYAQAAKQLVGRFRNVRFLLLGFTQEGNRRFVPEAQIRAWESTSGITWVGRCDDVRPVIAAADCVVLPSYYREGVPRSLLEAASMAKPIITTDTVGCREVVEHGVNGYLCRARDAGDLARAMRKMIELPGGSRRAMGMRSRSKILEEFDERVVLKEYTKQIDRLLTEAANCSNVGEQETAASRAGKKAGKFGAKS